MNASDEPGGTDYAVERQKTKEQRDQRALQKVEQRANAGA